MIKYTSINRLLIFFALTLVSCDGIFVPDPIDPQLPKYTEKGNNVAGAFIGKETWKSVVYYRWGLSSIIESNKPFITSYNDRDSLVICFVGELNDDDTFIEFHIKGMNVRKFGDLISLENKKIPLDGLKSIGVCIRYRTIRMIYHGRGGIGQLYIKKADVLNDSLITFSGTFGFTCYDASNKAYEVSYGRFDYKISKSTNFEKIEMYLNDNPEP